MTSNIRRILRNSNFRIAVSAMLGVLCIVFIGIGCKNGTAAAAGRIASAEPPTPKPATLESFHSDDELREFLKKRVSSVHYQETVMEYLAANKKTADMAVAKAAPAPARAATTDARAIDNPSITNNQVAGVDEGDIVKVHGKIMVILRRGRLFTISLANNNMRPIDHINAYPPNVSARSDWYDEMLLSDDTIAVIGYSYGRGGTEINRFKLSEDGHLRFLDCYHLRSYDYYSSRNYASRLIGDKLIFYTPLSLRGRSEDPLEGLPALRKWNTGREKFHRIISATQIYIPAAIRDSNDAPVDTIHAVTTCNLTAPEMSCSSTGVLGSESRTFYVSNTAVYLWVTKDMGTTIKDTHALLYRMPLNSSAPQAVGVRGAPVDQFAFYEKAGADQLYVLVRSESVGDKMWRSEFTSGSIALACISFNNFGNGADEVDKADYRFLPSPEGNGYDFHERFVGDYVLYGNGSGWGRPTKQSNLLTVVSLDDGVEPTQLRIPVGIDRIESLGNDALVVGSGKRDLQFVSIELGEIKPKIGATYTMPLAAQSETRSHAFFYQPDEDSPDGTSGILGLPVARPATAAYRQLSQNSMAMTFLRRTDRNFRPLGEIASSTRGMQDDGCTASCVDWYGNARPIFLNHRTFALLGYELVEGRVVEDRIEELNRTNFTPTNRRPARNSSWD